MVVTGKVEIPQAKKNWKTTLENVSPKRNKSKLWVFGQPTKPMNNGLELGPISCSLKCCNYPNIASFIRVL